ncbi:lipopolysaccharide-induced tumor necrosis factor-alpha factor homolog [Drosophila madeirensis]|uniref:Lipopolysaccharide-induced tumor necrosis factor-alpha factor homolog n=1 Tax=Drosophila madeirensis TaxID=30013 RepID=A0AAU9GFI1_DROMD|nr:lipopolysaccharide-induced tumor necrosis factor-alpha factor homolog [Drosophila subobscura]
MEPVYPAAPLEMQKGTAGDALAEHQQLLTTPRSPPSYDQATASPALTTGPAATPAPSAAPATVRHTVVVVPGSIYGPEPMDIQCPYCHNYARTRVSYRPNSRTHLIALVLCLFQLYCCVCLPYCIASCMNTTHYCGMCDHYLGSYQRK